MAAIEEKQVTIIIDELLEDYRTRPVDLLNRGDAGGEYLYLSSHKHEYIRTIQDIVKIVKSSPEKVKVLEIGSFLGIVSIALSKIGFDVTATDILEFISCKNLQKKLNDNNVKIPSVKSKRLHVAI